MHTLFEEDNRRIEFYQEWIEYIIESGGSVFF